MLNIRKDKIAVFAMYVLIAASLPPAVANALREEPKPVVQVVVDPLDKYKGVKELSDTELVGLLSAIGFEGTALKVAYAVAKKESNGRPLAHNGDVKTGDNSYGIFQINMLGNLGEDRREKFDLRTDKDLFDPVTNAEITFYMTNGGKDWSSWNISPGADNGARYKSFLERFPKD